MIINQICFLICALLFLSVNIALIILKIKINRFYKKGLKYEKKSKVG